jgi:hypothetical protein
METDFIQLGHNDAPTNSITTTGTASGWGNLFVFGFPLDHDDASPIGTTGTTVSTVVVSQTSTKKRKCGDFVGVNDYAPQFSRRTISGNPFSHDDAPTNSITTSTTGTASGWGNLFELARAEQASSNITNGTTTSVVDENFDSVRKCKNHVTIALTAKCHHPQPNDRNNNTRNVGIENALGNAKDVLSSTGPLAPIAIAPNPMVLNTVLNTTNSRTSFSWAATTTAKRIKLCTDARRNHILETIVEDDEDDSNTTSSDNEGGICMPSLPPKNGSATSINSCLLATKASLVDLQDSSRPPPAPTILNQDADHIVHNSTPRVANTSATGTFQLGNFAQQPLKSCGTSQLFGPSDRSKVLGTPCNNDRSGESAGKPSHAKKQDTLLSVARTTNGANDSITSSLLLASVSFGFSTATSISLELSNNWNEILDDTKPSPKLLTTPSQLTMQNAGKHALENDDTEFSNNDFDFDGSDDFIDTNFGVTNASSHQRTTDMSIGGALSSFPSTVLNTFFESDGVDNNLPLVQHGSRSASNINNISTSITNNTLSNGGALQGNGMISIHPAPNLSDTNTYHTENYFNGKDSNTTNGNKGKDPRFMANNNNYNEALIFDGPVKEYIDPMPLAMPSDKDHLTPLQCFVRLEEIELFSATEADIKSATIIRCRREPVTLGQVGIRCQHCLKPCYPSSVLNIYSATMNFWRKHVDECTSNDNKGKYKELKANKAKSKESKQYWIDEARNLGLVETPFGVRFSAFPLAIPVQRDRERQVVTRQDETTEAFEGRGDRSDECDASVVFEADMLVATTYTYLLMLQMRRCEFTNADGQGKRPPRFPGLACRHCFGATGSGRFFPSTEKTMCNKSKTLYCWHDHMMRCTCLKQEVKDNLVTLLALHNEELSRKKLRSQRAFFRLIWARLHSQSL